MMVNCPKCGFSQPDDQYCAKCGVDMVAFKAKVVASRSSFSSLPLQVGALAIVVIAGGLYVRNSNQRAAARLAADTPIVREIDQQESELAQARNEADEARRVMNQTSQASESAPTVGNVASNAPVAAAPAPAQQVGAFVPSSAPAVATAPASSASPAKSLKQALAPAQSVRVYFIEASKPLLQELMNEAHDGGGDGITNYGVVANLTQRLRNARGWQALQTGQDQSMKLNQPNMFLNVTRDAGSGQNVGVTVQVIPLSRDEAGTHLQIDANRTLRDDSFNFALPESVTIPKGASLLVTGVLPHRDLAPGESQLYRSVNVLKSMTAEPFHSGQTDVAFIVEAH